MNFEPLLKRLLHGPQWQPGQPYLFQDPEINGPSPRFWPGYEQVTEQVTQVYLLQPHSDYGKRAYDARGLAGRRAHNIIEAGLKLIIERGTIDSCEGFVVNRDFENSDFSLGVYQGVWMFRVGPLQRCRQILWADEETGTIHEADGSVYEFGQLLDLANGQALAATTPALEQRPAAAQRCLMFLNAILNHEMGTGDLLMRTNHYQVERRGQVITLKNQHGNQMLLQGDGQSLAVEVSYLSSTDALHISNEYQRVTHFDFERQADLRQAQMIVGEEDDIVSQILPMPLSVWDVERSWTVPLGEIPTGPIDRATALAVVEAANLIVESVEGHAYTGAGFEINKWAGDIEILDPNGQRLVQRALGQLPVVEALDSQSAAQILRFAQAHQAQLQQGCIQQEEQRKQQQAVHRFNWHEAVIDAEFAPPVLADELGEDDVFNQ